MSISSLAAAFQPQAISTEPRPVRPRPQGQDADVGRQPPQQAQTDGAAEPRRSVNLLV